MPVLSQFSKFAEHSDYLLDLPQTSAYFLRNNYLDLSHSSPNIKYSISEDVFGVFRRI